MRFAAAPLASARCASSLIGLSISTPSNPSFLIRANFSSNPSALIIPIFTAFLSRGLGVSPAAKGVEEVASVTRLLPRTRRRLCIWKMGMVFVHGHKPGKASVRIAKTQSCGVFLTAKKTNVLPSPPNASKIPPPPLISKCLTSLRLNSWPSSSARSMVRSSPPAKGWMQWGFHRVLCDRTRRGDAARPFPRPHVALLYRQSVLPGDCLRDRGFFRADPAPCRADTSAAAFSGCLGDGPVSSRRGEVELVPSPREGAAPSGRSSDDVKSFSRGKKCAFPRDFALSDFMQPDSLSM